MLTLAAMVAFLYGVFFLFERKHREIDGYEVAGAVIMPAILAFLVHIADFFLELGPWVGYAATGVFIVGVFLVLWRMLSVPVGRSAAYTGALIVFTTGFSFLPALLLG